MFDEPHRRRRMWCDCRRSMRTETQWGREGEIESAHAHIMIYVLCISRYIYIHTIQYVYTYTCTHGPNNNLLILSIAPHNMSDCQALHLLMEALKVGWVGPSWWPRDDTFRLRLVLRHVEHFENWCLNGPVVLWCSAPFSVPLQNQWCNPKKRLRLEGTHHRKHFWYLPWGMYWMYSLKTWNMLKLFTFGLYPWLYQISDFLHATWKNQVGWWGRWSK